MNPEKSSVATDAGFQEAIGKATAEGGKTFWAFLDDAREAYKRSRKRTRNRPKMVPPGKGFDRALSLDPPVILKAGSRSPRSDPRYPFQEAALTRCSRQQRQSGR